MKETSVIITRPVKKFNMIGFQKETKETKAFYCNQCEGLISYVWLPKITRCSHCGNKLEWKER